MNYIHYNAVRAGYVDAPEEYPYSSYRNYFAEERKIVLPVTILHFGSEEGFIFVPSILGGYKEIVLNLCN